MVKINAEFFAIFLGIQTGLCFILTVVVGPVLISRSLSGQETFDKNASMASAAR